MKDYGSVHYATHVRTGRKSYLERQTVKTAAYTKVVRTQTNDEERLSWTDKTAFERCGETGRARAAQRVGMPATAGTIPGYRVQFPACPKVRCTAFDCVWVCAQVQCRCVRGHSRRARRAHSSAKMRCDQSNTLGMHGRRRRTHMIAYTARRFARGLAGRRR